MPMLIPKYIFADVANLTSSASNASRKASLFSPITINGWTILGDCKSEQKTYF